MAPCIGSLSNYERTFGSWRSQPSCLRSVCTTVATPLRASCSRRVKARRLSPDPRPLSPVITQVVDEHLMAGIREAATERLTELVANYPA
jgi:hypothetical protein